MARHYCLPMTGGARMQRLVECRDLLHQRTTVLEVRIANLSGNRSTSDGSWSESRLVTQC